MRELRARPDVALVEPNLIRHTFLVPNDHYYPLQWNLKVANLEPAWDQTTGSGSVVVAVVDSGIMADHPDLQGRIILGYDFVSNLMNAGDGDGWDPDPTDLGSTQKNSSGLHGTHVAGILGAATNNVEGVAGANWGCRILAIRAIGVDGSGTDADIAAAIRWAAGLEVAGAPPNPTAAKVINLSLGDYGASAALSKAVVEAQKAGAIIVAAAGNGEPDAAGQPVGVDASHIYPAAIPGVLTVGATKYNGTRAPYSNFGPVVEIMAPGGYKNENLPFQFEGKTWRAGVISTLYDAVTHTWGYDMYDGTSQAAPLVSGIVAMMLAVDPRLTGEQVAEIIQATASPAAQCDEGCGAGLVDAAAAINRVLGGANSPQVMGNDGCTGGNCGVLGPGVVGGCTVASHGSGSPERAISAAALLLLCLCCLLRMVARRRGQA